jgi:GT2 family glycosyltransferase
VLSVGVYLVGKPNHADHIVDELETCTQYEVAQRWVALGGYPTSASLRRVTQRAITGSAPKITLLNELLSREVLSEYEFVILFDDDVRLPPQFLDGFLRLQTQLGFCLAQPARTSNSYIDHSIVRQQAGVLARETRFVEVGPVVSVHRSAFGFLFPLDHTSPMGWGLENVWAYEVSRRGLKMGIIDGYAVDHSLRATAEYYNRSAADQGRQRLHNDRAHLPLEECCQVIETTPVSVRSPSCPAAGPPGFSSCGLDVVHHMLPADAKLLVIAGADDAHLGSEWPGARQFPRGVDGASAGPESAGDLMAVAQLESLRVAGATHLLVTATGRACWERLGNFRAHVESRYRSLVREDDTCLLFSLVKPDPSGIEAARAAFRDVVSTFLDRFGHEPAVLDCGSGLALAENFPLLTVFSPPTDDSTLPYLDDSIDIVVAPEAGRPTLSEAWRVALAALVIVATDQTAEPAIRELRWQPNAREGPRRKTSIIIPVYNGLAHTAACLTTLLETLPAGFDVEVIVVDDASTDGTARLLAEWAGRDHRLSSQRNAENMGFLTSANRGAGAARGDLLVFLNNDTVLLPGWLPPLLQTFRSFSDVGAIGGRLLFDDGRLQEAGGFILRDGSAGHFGRGDPNPDAEAYNIVRDVAYCSGALLATPRRLFEELGGFDPAYSFGYYEDTDYCFRVRRRGYRVLYQPESVIVHLEGATAGRDLALGLKHYQDVNRQRFVERWADVLASLPERPASPDRMARLSQACLGAGQEGGRP